MTEPREITGLPQSFDVTVFDKKPESWKAIRSSIVKLTEDALSETEEKPLLGGTDDTIAYANIEAAFLSPDSTAVVIRNAQTSDVVGYTLAMPIGRMYPKRSSESNTTAYIYYTVLAEDQRGKGLVGKLMDPLHLELDKKGYSFVERDAHIVGGYADKIIQHYGSSVLDLYDHEKWPEIGPERFFRIDNKKYLEQRGIKTSV